MYNSINLFWNFWTNLNHEVLHKKLYKLLKLFLKIKCKQLIDTKHSSSVFKYFLDTVKEKIILI